MPSAGKIADAMEAFELDPSEVTHVVFTHAHPTTFGVCWMISMIRCFLKQNI